MFPLSLIKRSPGCLLGGGGGGGGDVMVSCQDKPNVGSDCPHTYYGLYTRDQGFYVDQWVDKVFVSLS